MFAFSDALHFVDAFGAIVMLLVMRSSLQLIE
jgi:hypothetical protein